ncbi:hypothetical protein BV917_09800 [Leptospira santarosai serovar Guaricura]|uniref:STAS-like domain-containing protein n=1 Tax=Leptospira santarosai TaxID=28183 RepID=UPI000960B898|nr:STAS-like domain-containing protein [Leptospira santarosai]OLY60730.1 hypothetical protein BV917_09800 [Leptospira santarosai serovar Guaricura]
MNLDPFSLVWSERCEYLDILILKDSNVEGIEIDMDDTWGYPSSFLEECFGGLVHKYGKDLIKSKIEIISNQDESLKERILHFLSFS